MSPRAESALLLAPTGQSNNFFYMISQLNEQEFLIEIPYSKKRYVATLDRESELGITGLPFEWERCIFHKFSDSILITI